MRVVLEREREREDDRSIWTLSIQDSFKQSSSLVSRKSEIVRKEGEGESWTGREDNREKKRNGSNQK